MAKDGTIRPKGLYTSPNKLSSPGGGLDVADNVVIQRPGVIECRRGMASYLDNRVATSLYVSGTNVIAYGGGAVMYYPSGATWAAYSGSASAYSSGANATFASLGQNVYFTVYTGGTINTAVTGVKMFNANDTTQAIYDTAYNVNFGFEPLAGYEFPIGALVRTGGNLVTATFTGMSQRLYKVGDTIQMTAAGEANFAAGPFTITTVGPGYITYAEAGANVASAVLHIFRHPTLRGTGGFLVDGNQCAYRCLIKTKDSNDNYITSEASGRHFIRNTSSTHGYAGGVDKNTYLRVLVTANYYRGSDVYVEVYRSKQTVATIEPSDELQLCYSKKLTATDMSNQNIAFTDEMPDELLGRFIYTATSQEGLENNSYAPPISQDLATFGNCLLFGATKQPHSVGMQLVSVPTAGDTLSIYRPAATTLPVPFYNFSTTEHPYFSNTAPSVGKLILPAYSSYASTPDNVRFTTQVLCESMNLYTWFLNDNGWLVLSSYEPKDKLATGTFRMRNLFTANAGFSPLAGGTLTSSATSTIEYNPIIGTNVALHLTWTCTRVGTTVTVSSAGTHGFAVGDVVTLLTNSADFPSGDKTITSVPLTTSFTYTEAGAAVAEASKVIIGQLLYSSDNDNAPNRIMWSKTGDGNAVPYLNYEDIGDKQSAIIRCMPTRDSCFIFKEDGTWRMTGSNGDFRIESFDPTVILKGRRTAVSLDNNVVALTNKGVLLITDTGVELISLPIQNDLLKLFDFSSIEYWFAIGNEADRQYELYTLTTQSATVPYQCYAYNLNTKAWTRLFRNGSLPAVHGVFNINDSKRYLAGETKVHYERRSYDKTDYSDASVSVTISTVTNSTTVVLSSGVDQQGGILQQGVLVSRITGSTGGTTLFLESAQAWTAAAATIHPAIYTEVKFNHVTSGDASTLKAFSDFELLFGDGHIPRLTVYTETDVDRTQASIVVDTKTLFDQWVDADTTYSGIDRPAGLRVDIPQQHVRANRIIIAYSTREAWALFNVVGLVVTADGNDETQGE